ncbi:MAG: hypothetical protein P8Y65_08185 [Campylobacterales bacterium]
MIKKLFYVLVLAQAVLYAATGTDKTTPYRTYAALQYEYLDFSHSKQKEEGERWTLHMKQRLAMHTVQAALEKTRTQTVQPPLKEDLDVTKFYLRYTAALTPKHELYANYITISDNLVPTDDGRIYGLGYGYRWSKNAAMTLYGYYSDYDIFDAYQFDAALQLGRRFGAVNTAVQLIGKSIFIENCESGFCKNAQRSYFTPGVKLKAATMGYFVHAGAFFGKRVFAVMQDGLMVQHHAMEFSETYMGGVGKRWNGFELKLRYVYQKATELPFNNSGIVVQNGMLRVGYAF